MRSPDDECDGARHAVDGFRQAFAEHHRFLDEMRRRRSAQLDRLLAEIRATHEALDRCGETLRAGFAKLDRTITTISAPVMNGASRTSSRDDAP